MNVIYVPPRKEEEIKKRWCYAKGKTLFLETENGRGERVMQVGFNFATIMFIDVVDMSFKSKEEAQEAFESFMSEYYEELKSLDLAYEAVKNFGRREAFYDTYRATKNIGDALSAVIGLRQIELLEKLVR